MKWQLVVAGLAFGVSLAGQSPSPGSTPAPAPTGEVNSKPSNRVEQRAQSMRDQIDQGKTVNSHVRVAVRLKNGNKLLGVVKDGKLVERVDGLRFVDAQAQEKGAGIRLWYTGGTRNWVFVPFHDFADYEVLQQLSNKQILAIEAEMQMRERSAAERQAAQKEKAAADAPGAAGQETPPSTEPTDPAGGPATSPGAGNGSEGAKANPAPGAKKPADPAAAPGNIEVEKQREWFALLQAYPPASGWGQEKRDEIARRKVVIGAEPSAAEKNFVAQFDEWKKACDHFKVVAPPKPGEGSDDVSADERPSSPRRKKERQQNRQQNSPDQQ